jgi:hypothetical protein
VPRQSCCACGPGPPCAPGRVESRLEGDLDLRGFLGICPDVRNGYEQVRVTFKIQSGAPREQLEELCRLAQARSPVFDIVTHGVPVDVRLAG